jgi:hypothetical protein
MPKNTDNLETQVEQSAGRHNRNERRYNARNGVSGRKDAFTVTLMVIFLTFTLLIGAGLIALAQTIYEAW